MSAARRRPVVAAESGIAVRSAADVSDVLGACLGSAGLILTEAELGPAFFDLRTRVAGELFQKFVNYRVRMAIVMPDPGTHGERWKELAVEHRRHPVVRFVASRADAEAWLGS